MARTSLTLYIPDFLQGEVMALLARWADGVSGADVQAGHPQALVPIRGRELSVPTAEFALMDPISGWPASPGCRVVITEVVGPEWALQDLLDVFATGSDALAQNLGVSNVAALQRL